MAADRGRWASRQNPLPHLVLIADGFAGGSERMSGADVQRTALDAPRAAPLWLHLRDHGVDGETFAAAAEAFVEALRAVRSVVTVSINTHLDVAKALGTGVHVGVRGPAVEEARRLGPGALVSASVHTLDEAYRAVEQGADALVFSPVFPTTSKPGHTGTGLDALRACCDAVPGTPVFALGGVTPARVRSCLDAGAYGVAVLSGILHAAEPATAARSYLEAL